MKFAQVNGKREEATKSKERGLCEECGGLTIAHCGIARRKIWHWKHAPGSKSPNCWAGKEETPWHREWKDSFPKEWQEFMHKDTSGEIHRADVKTTKGVVLEFQYSAIDSQERQKREEFYGDMVWVVNGARVEGYYKRFSKNLNRLRKFKNVHLFSTDSPDEIFPVEWTESKVPVYFDFERNKTNDVIDLQDKVRSFLCCLLPGRAQGQAVIMRIAREEFVSWSMNNSHLQYAQAIMSEVSKALQHGVELRYGRNP